MPKIFAIFGLFSLVANFTNFCHVFRYMPEKLMEHIKIFHLRMNVVKMLRACEKALLWTESVYLYKEDGQHDAAVKTMVDHCVSFQHDLFLDCVQKVRNPEVQYKAISFYVNQHPLQLSRLLQVLTPNLDHARVIHLLRKERYGFRVGLGEEDLRMQYHVVCLLLLYVMFYVYIAS